jgi:hypothetical protein
MRFAVRPGSRECAQTRPAIVAPPSARRVHSLCSAVFAARAARGFHTLSSGALAKADTTSTRAMASLSRCASRTGLRAFGRAGASAAAAGSGGSAAW